MIYVESFTNSGGREKNEDSIGVEMKNSDEGCFVLCDGLGGHGQGEIASQLVVQDVLQCYRSEGNTEEFIPRTLENSQRDLLSFQKEHHAKNEMKTTVVVLLIQDGKVQWGHVGDSRLYFFQNGKYISRTMDHSVPQTLANAGKIKEKQIRKHPDRNRLLRVMGSEWSNSQYSISEVLKINKEQAFLLCSDGFWELITEKEMEKTLKKARKPDEWLQKMIEIVQRRGAHKEMDNLSAIAVWIGE